MAFTFYDWWDAADADEKRLMARHLGTSVNSLRQQAYAYRDAEKEGAPPRRFSMLRAHRVAEITELLERPGLPRMCREDLNPVWGNIKGDTP